MRILPGFGCPDKVLEVFSPMDRKGICEVGRGEVSFGRALTPEQVVRRGITTLTREQMQQALDQGKCIKHVSSLRLLSEDGMEVSRATANSGSIPTRLEARVEPQALPLSDPLARTDGLLNAIVIQTDTPAKVTVIGPGAGRFQAGQGMLADLIAIAKSR